jgi:hypothetical protein
MHDALGILLP